MQLYTPQPAPLFISLRNMSYPPALVFFRTVQGVAAVPFMAAVGYVHLHPGKRDVFSGTIWWCIFYDTTPSNDRKQANNGEQCSKGIVCILSVAALACVQLRASRRSAGPPPAPSRCQSVSLDDTNLATFTTALALLLQPMELTDRTWWALRAGEVAGARFDDLKAPIVTWRLAAALAGCETCVSPYGSRVWMAD